MVTAKEEVHLARSSRMFFFALPDSYLYLFDIVAARQVPKVSGLP
jgi:hypothetical protein